ncbi:hypothetical protein SXANM310S_06368 [Streptomyces xanthochromogenes]
MTRIRTGSGPGVLTLSTERHLDEAVALFV